ncbi:MAG: glycosyltransferase family 4 protein [Candidatus Binatia bacterium]
MSPSPNTARSVAVCALVPYPPGTTPSQRFRIEQWTSQLERQGIHIECVPFVDARLMEFLHEPGRTVAKSIGIAAAFVRRARDVARSMRYDAVVVHRAICLAGPAIFERALANLSRPMIFDFDDAINVLHTSSSNSWTAWLKSPGKTATLCKISRSVVAGNSHLATYARQFNSRVAVVPTSIDTERYQPRRRAAANGRVVVGWTGSATSQTYLEWFAPTLRTIQIECDVELTVLSNRRPALQGVPFEWRQWNPNTEVEDLERIDVGIMPMPDDPWARGKCALKALQYMAMGVPAVCSPVGTNIEVIRHGENGLLAATPEEWVRGIRELSRDVSFRERLGKAGRRTVEEQYSSARCARLFGDALIGAIDGEPRRPQ